MLARVERFPVSITLGLNVDLSEIIKRLALSLAFEGLRGLPALFLPVIIERKGRR